MSIVVYVQEGMAHSRTDSGKFLNCAPLTVNLSIFRQGNHLIYGGVADTKFKPQ